MRLREVLILTLLLCILTAVVGASVLFYVYVWRQPPLAEVPVATTAVNVAVDSTSALEASPTPKPLPALVTPTRTETPPPTPSPVATATSTPTPSLTPGLAPSPTLDLGPSLTLSPTLGVTPSSTPSTMVALPPDAQLTDAYLAKRYGDYRLARTEFRSVLETSENGDARREALYQLGVCALLDQEYAAAESLLSQFLAENESDPRAGAAHYHLARALDGLERHAEARGHYLAYLGQQDVLTDVVYTQIAEQAAQAGDYQTAVEAYERAVESAPDLSQQYDLREQLGLAYASWGHYDEAVASLQSITEVSQNASRLARIWYLIGQIYRQAGREAEAIDAFSQAVYGDPQAGYAHAALVALVDALVEVDEFQRGLIDYYAGSYAAAAEAFGRYIEDTPDYDSDARYYSALSYLANGFPERAIQECELALSAFSTTIPHWGDLWLVRARALAAQGRTSDAVTAYLAFADDNRDHAQAPDALWEAASLLEKDGQLGKTADVYTSLADRHVNDQRAPTARFRAGIARYRVDDLDGALVAWRELANGYPSSAQALGGRYWIGKVLWAEGDEQQARETLQLLADQHPYDYYGLRAAHLLANSGRPPGWPGSPPSLHLTTEGAVLQEEAQAWLREWSGADPGADLSTVREDLASNLHFRRAIELAALERLDAARDELETLRAEYGQDAVALYQIAVVSRDLGIYAPSVRAAIGVTLLAPEESIFEMPVFIQQLLYPAYFPDLVVEESRAYGLDPLLMFSLIRQESLFDDKIASWAGAVGLTQIMPSTGQWIAQMMPWPAYAERDLTRAYLNAKFGTWFMARILGMTEGNVAAALVGYNGGPSNAQHWFEAAKGDPDLFVEVIDRDEPQRYVREIYRQYDVYARLYGSGP